jgi:hypothetical protein
MNNVEAIIIAWLNSNITGYATYSDTPKTPPTKYILVEREGGGREAMVLDQSSIAIHVYHKTSGPDASNTANLIADTITGLLSNDNITRAKVNSIVRLDDVIKQYYQYIVYVDVYHRR